MRRLFAWKRLRHEAIETGVVVWAGTAIDAPARAEPEAIDVNFREAVPADGDAIRAIVTETLAEFGFPIEADGVDSDLDDIQGAYQRHGGSFRVLVDDQATVVGCGGLFPMDDQTAELRKMYFRPEVRGRGLGRELLHDLVEQARANGFDRIVLETASNLTAAIRLYESFGFTETIGPKHSCRCDRMFMLRLR